MRLPLVDTYVQLVKTNREFRLLWFSQIISQLGDWFNLIASATLVAGLSGSGLAIGGLFLARLLPPFVFGPFVGVIADRFDRRNVMIVSDVLRTIVVLGFLLVRSEEQIWLLYLLTVLQLSVSAFFEPTRAAILPSLVARKDLVTANALAGTTWSAMLALGAALGGGATALLGTDAAFLMDAATYLLSAYFVKQIHLSPEAIARLADDASYSRGGWADFVDGVRYLWHNRPILALSLVKAAGAAAYGGIAVVEVNIAEQVYPIGDDGSGTLGLIYFVIGLGTGFGPLLARRISGDNIWPMHRMILASFAASTVGYIIINNSVGLPFGFGILLVASVIRSSGSGTGWVFSSALIQMTAPDRMLGRIFAFDLAMMTLASSLSTLAVGWMQDYLMLGPFQITGWLGGVAMTMFMLWGLYLFIQRQRLTELANNQTLN